ncbi:MAG: DUF2817 domain-containing protein [Ramlibacter sp.]|nr:DUF2817 domain-containing protein [Ramlibacter sp.]
MTRRVTSDNFSSSYAQARSRFLEAAAKAGIAVDSKIHPELGRDGEELAMDIAFDGSPDAKGLLIVSSGCHGVEGFCGSGVQVAALHDDEWRRYARGHGVAVMYIHALNPHGFSYIRRTTHENIDLNRNFHDFSIPLPVNNAYRDLAPLLLPEEWPPGEANGAAVMAYAQQHGMDVYQAAITRGQHEFADGLFFGGTQPSWSNTALREILRKHGRNAARLGWIDLHTGLGPSGVGERIFAGRDDAATLTRARNWWGGNGKTPVTSIYDGSSTSAFLTGLMWESVYDECPQAEYTSIALEYGTVPVNETLDALRADQWLQLHPQAPAAKARQIKQQMLETFFTDTDEWKSQILLQAREAMFQAVDGLAA